MVAGLPAVSLDDKYRFTDGRVFMSGVQALVRLPLVQQARDKAEGFNTGGFISGYRGSPLGTYDQELWRAKKMLAERNIVFVPGVNEELGATAVWGSQHVGMRPGATVDGVFGIWYGKGPGLDRAMDVLKHANAAGTSPRGGVLAIVGDDHGAKSSTLPHQSDHNFQAAFVPFLAPASVHEFVEYGLLGLAMSRFAGTWVGFKATADTVETSATVDLANEQRRIIIPHFDFPEGGIHIRGSDIWREEDTRLQRFKGFAAMAFAKANGIDRIVFDTPRPRFGIVTTGKAYADTMEALDELGIDARVASDIGLRVYKVGMPWPLEPDGMRSFAEGLEEVLVIEEKREFIEHQLKWQLYNWRESVRPRVVGKQDEHGDWLLSPDNELTPGVIAHVIAARIQRYHDSERIRARLTFFNDQAGKAAAYVTPIKRAPYFCSGCPHNTSTKPPEGSRALAGIGCHIMALWMDRAETFTQMGGEGVTWVGEAPFTSEKHVFANLGDGTYFHSGLLAIRQSIAAGVNITYKILYNDAVAMTGGQKHDGELSVDQIAGQMVAENAKKVVVLTEDLTRYQGVTLPASVRLLDRSALPAIQDEFAATTGCTVIIFDQTCAAEKRRRRKRKTMVDPDRRIFINPAVCEGCGDCSVQSNCVSVEPLETEFGRKRRINQSSCNKDYSCVKGFCPSFITIDGAEVKKSRADFDAEGLPEPVIPAAGHGYNIMVTGIGGTGVLTVSALLGTAGHIEGRAATTADMAGLAQKGGAVYSHVRLAATNDDLLSPRIIAGGADLVLACDAVVAADKPTQALMIPDRTAVVANADIAPTADFVRNRDLDFQSAQVERTIRGASNPNACDFIAADTIAVAVMGDAIAANIIVLGYAWQKGLIPLQRDSLEAAIELNGVAVDFNKRAFGLGRLLAVRPDKVEALVAAARGPQPEPPATSFDEVIARRVADLTAYQDAAYAERFATRVAQVRAAGGDDLAEAVGRSLYKLMAYKDEYEVARLYSDDRFTAAYDAQFAGGKPRVLLAPPLFSRTDPATGRPKKISFGPWIFTAFGVLAKLKGLRGTALDVFSYTEERRSERAAIAAYEAEVDQLLAGLTPDNRSLALAIARLPMDVRGFGPVKDKARAEVEKRRAALWAKWPGERARAAA
ncbi:indolepyruvate ferredoxin oxidoreductase family protein [Polymorphobacter fuscus]|uniref:Indolepyruvate ferredoxin oxidoreductase family protein n=1 Tax=Sandarakinorhabdus fusca TaxID=1439888 RepID=A0A7C9KH75_9SPHN|nr:indolepyruvate ferredoxin oxidoreductase family protein [Polymorphobacter fuscus]KAB7648610.1 indolepyruvate ferredoxin oxidoreductase family protein [Polymorphobacter fuscus]MQT16159.1 indolepyruvate ferredoxin oxidoreductase family protein [Polymorphobacter fuscus]NJC07562.1 indolepyruvate ferredoxin oxidoreductase [Polymorphobacter fuscus]